MYDETKKAVTRAFSIGKILFGMGPIKFERLVGIVNKIAPPSKKEIVDRMEEGLDHDEAIAALFKERYKQAAVEAGYTEEQGLAALSYAAMLREISS